MSLSPSTGVVTTDREISSSRRPYFQFSLRSLFFWVVAISCICGMVGLGVRYKQLQADFRRQELVLNEYLYRYLASEETIGKSIDQIPDIQALCRITRSRAGDTFYVHLIAGRPSLVPKGQSLAQQPALTIILEPNDVVYCFPLERSIPTTIVEGHHYRTGFGVFTRNREIQAIVEFYVAYDD